MQPTSSRTQPRYTSETLKPEARRSRKSQVLLRMPVWRLSLRRKNSQTSSSKRLALKKVEEFLRQLHKVLESKMFPHFLAMFQWTLLVMSIVFNKNFSVAVTGAVANDGLKVIMLFHLWMPFFAIVLCTMFYRIRKEGIAERCIISLSIIVFLFSIANISLHFVDDFVLLMKATELVAWSFYNAVFSISIYKILVVFLPFLPRRFAKSKKETLPKDKKLWTLSQKCGKHH